MTWFVISLLMTVDGQAMRAEAKYENAEHCALGLAEFEKMPDFTVLLDPPPCREEARRG